MRNRILTIGILLLAFLFAAFVWPTRWRYYKEYYSRGGTSLSVSVSFTTIVRIDRFTGKAYSLTDNGWQLRKPE